MDVAKLLSRSQVADMLLKELREKVARLRQQGKLITHVSDANALS